MKLEDIFLRDTRANQPAATAVARGTLYYVTDEGLTERSNGTSWEDCSNGGGGDVVGPASATDGVPALFNGTTGQLIKNSTPTGTGNPVLASSPTIVTPTIADFTNAQHDHADAAGGGTVSGGGGGSGAAKACKAYVSGSPVAVASATLVKIPCNAEDFDTDNIHDNSTNNTRFTIPTSGKYICVGGVELLGDAAPSAGALVLLRIMKNNGGSPEVEVRHELIATNTSGRTTFLNVSAILNLTAGDYIEFAVYHDSSTASHTITPGTASFGSVAFLGT